jgi:hypothetical protein
MTQRMTFMNKVVCQMGRDGIVNQMKLAIRVTALTVGTVNLSATTIPKGAWQC